MKRVVDRVVDGEGMDLFQILVFLLTLPRDLSQVEALAVFPGLGEHWRVQHVIHDWEKGFGEQLLLAGAWQGEKTWEDLGDFSLLESWGLKRTQGVYSQVYAQHTQMQSEWILERHSELGFKSLALYVSPYHLARAYLTLLKEMMKKIENSEYWFSIIPVPVSVPPDVKIPEIKVNAWNMLPGELERIEKYQEMGDVVTLEEFRGYISWLWKNFLNHKR